MKKAFIVAFVLPLVFACGRKEKLENQTLHSQVAQLNSQLAQRDSTLNSYLGLISEVDNNLSIIRERENLINLSKDKALTESDKEQMVKDIQTINALMKENKQKLADLNRQLEHSNVKMHQFSKMVADLNEKVKDKDAQLGTLNDQVTMLTAENTNLTNRVDSLNTQTTAQASTIEDQKQKIENQGDVMNTAYVASGTAKDLMAKNVIKKEGGLLGIGAVETLNRSVSKDLLRPIDIRNTYSIPIESKKVELVTNHPKDSYQLVQDSTKHQVDKLVILDPNKFWQSSKYLVMITK